MVGGCPLEHADMLAAGLVLINRKARHRKLTSKMRELASSRVSLPYFSRVDEMPSNVGNSLKGSPVYVSVRGSCRAGHGGANSGIGHRAHISFQGREGNTLQIRSSAQTNELN